MKSFRLIAAALVAACLASAAAWAADPSGTWKWSQQGREGQPPREFTLKLELKDGKLAGSLTMPGRGGGAPTEVAISDASFKDDEVAFSLVREFNGNKMVTKYTGKLAGDTIKGSSEGMGRDGQVQKRDLEAKRAK
jgi:hypothetical protein